MPRSWESLKQASVDSQERREKDLDLWIARAGQHLGERTSWMFFCAGLLGIFVFGFVNLLTYMFQPEVTGGTAWLVGGGYLVGVVLLACLLWVDFHGNDRRLSTPLVLSWLAVPVATVLLDLIESSDTGTDTSASEAVARTASLVIPMGVFWLARRALSRKRRIGPRSSRPDD